MNLSPSTQLNLFEHKKIFEDLSKLYLNGKLPNKIILSGEKGIGKATLAYHLINFILSKNEEGSYNYENNIINSENKSYKLIQNKSNPNFNLIDVLQEKKNIDINQIRDLIIHLNKSSFNKKKRFVLIDNVELLNINSINALLKILEEPNQDINFILIHNNRRVLSTLKSRCLNFKVNLTKDQSIRIINQILKEDIHNIINNTLLDNYITPGKLYKIKKFSDEYHLDLVNLSLDQFLKSIFIDKIYKKDKSIIDIIYSFIELYFRNNISIKNINILRSYRYFLKKIYNTKIYNLDEETLFMEIEDRLLNE
tara:strand:- start:114 stop:1043 length:930 start_codon:yes stop_codon:yes gene_type:complete